MKANIYANNFSQAKTIHLKTHKTMQDFCYISFNDDIFADDLALLLEKSKESLEILLQNANYNLSVFANEGIRIVRYLDDENFNAFNTESVKLRLNEKGQLAMLHNHPCDCHKEFSSFAWALWSFVNNLVLEKKGA
ncbi:hypothetical protein [Campylobacter upsaliensis]|uniref:Uncharacterized protein n=1 Tax=Campylobacter upsaliensis TaxID=28080 RepID=A0A381F3R3_CAMUP|nr:hypothetical protein [Campylobacter upsaliensis]MCR2101076.1 hypothetical protein [Campylobacter upsaliensis]SUX41128.1 Uncharacterised protein [Campylobacter upsaliensis]